MILLFLKLNGITGESTNADYRNWIEVLSYSWATARAEAGRLLSSPLQLTASMGRHSPPLMEALTQSTQFRECRLVGVTGQRNIQFLEIALTGGTAVNFDVAGSASADYPAEVWSFQYSRVSVKYWTISGNQQGTLVESQWQAGDF
jgi:type VI secretion system secreted protein Hcp